MTNRRVLLVVLLACGPNGAWAQTADDQQDDVNSAYLVADEPAQRKVSEVEAALGLTREELTRAQAARQAVESRTERLGQHSQASADTSAAVLDTLTRLKREADSYEARMDDYRGSVPIAWVASALLVALVGGFLAGMWWFGFLSRRRHGGFKIY